MTTKRACLTLNSSANKSVHRPDSCYNMAKVGPACKAMSHCNLMTCTSSLSRVNPMKGSMSSYTTLLRVVTKRSAGSDASVGERSLRFSGRLAKSVGKVGFKIPRRCLTRKLSPRMGTSFVNILSALGRLKTRMRFFSVGAVRCVVPTCCVVTDTRTDSGLRHFSKIGCNFHTTRCRNLRSVCGGAEATNFNRRMGHHVVLNSFILDSNCCSTCCLGTLHAGTLVGGRFSRTFNGCSILLTPTSPFATPGVNRDLGSPLTVCLKSVCAMTIGLYNLPKVAIPYKGSDGNLPVNVRVVKSYFVRGGVLHTTRTCRADHNSFTIPKRKNAEW